MDKLTYRTLAQIHSVLTDFDFYTKYPFLFGDELNDKMQEARIVLEQLQSVLDQEEFRYLSWYIEEAVKSHDVEHIIEELDRILEY